MHGMNLYILIDVWSAPRRWIRRGKIEKKRYVGPWKRYAFQELTDEENVRERLCI
jgi:hypothetical protein